MQETVQERETLLEVKNLKTYFFLDEGIVRAVDDVTFELGREGVLGVVGESGCGKSVSGPLHHEDSTATRSVH